MTRHNEFAQCHIIGKNQYQESLLFAAEMRRLDPFQDAASCWHPDWYWPTAKERRAGRLAANQALRESLRK